VPQAPRAGATPQPAARCPETPESAFGFHRIQRSDSIGILNHGEFDPSTLTDPVLSPHEFSVVE
jgi:hypothetical protein